MEACVRVYDRGNARLLQHNFRDPDAVGVARSTPWQIALIGLEPMEKFPLKFRQVSCGKHHAGAEGHFRTSADARGRDQKLMLNCRGTGCRKSSTSWWESIRAAGR